MGRFSIFGKFRSSAEFYGKRRYFLQNSALLIFVITASALTLSPLLKKDTSRHWQIIRPPHEVSALAERGEFIWAGGKDGVFKLDKNNGTLVMELKCDVAISYVRALLVDASGVLWIAHSSGVSSYDDTLCKTYTTNDGLPDNRSNALYRDRRGNLWVGTWSGAAVFKGNGFVKYTPDGALADEMVNVIMEDGGGGMWFGSYNAPRGGISSCDNARCRHFTVKNGLPHNAVTSIKETTDGRVWVGTGFLDKGGAAWFEKGRDGWALAGSLLKGDGLAGDKVRSIYVDKRGAIWYCSEYDGIAIRSDNRWRMLTEKDGLSDNEVKMMLEDVNGRVWFGTRDGVTRMTQKEYAEVMLR
jgi:ligand-binding sensor domain-containing protein